MPSPDSSASIQIGHGQNTPVEKTYQLITDDFRNDMFEDNMAYFKVQQPTIYKIVKNHRCTDYRLCLNPDSSPNIMHMPSKKLLYYSDGNMIFNSLKAKLDAIPFSMEINPVYAMVFKSDWYERNPIATRMYQSLFDLGPIKILAKDDSRRQFNKTFNPDFIPYLHIYGVGLGYHITQLIQSKDIQSIVIYEPEIDLFYASLYTTPWRLFFKYLQLDPNRQFSLIVAAEPEEAIKVEQKFLLKHHSPFIAAAKWQFEMFQTPPIQKFIELEKNAHQILAESLIAGWYEDQRAGLVNVLGNLITGKKIFTGAQLTDFLRIAIVGAGPSLDDSIAYLQQHSSDFIIFACGTAITPLLKHGIVPDYHVHQERRSDAEAVISWAGIESYKDTIALKLNVVEAGVDELYKDAYLFQKINDPASALLSEQFPVTNNVNPTVTNTAISFAAELGADEVYLFGVDYGAASDKERMHADNYIHAHRPTEKVDKTSEYTLQGNLGQTIISTEKLILSHNTAQIAIKSHPQITWFNVAEGALIENAIPLNMDDMPHQFEQNLDKALIKKMLINCFNNDYSINEIIDSLENHHFRTITEYFAAIRGFLNVSPTSRSMIINTLTSIHQAVETGKEIDHFMPHKLFSGGIRHFIENVYIQNSLFNSDTEAVDFFNSAIPVLEQYLDDLQQDITGLIANTREQLSEFATDKPKTL